MRVETRIKTVREIQIEDRLNNFIKIFSEDLCSLELLLFFSRHPHARFNKTAILHASTTKKLDASAALEWLVDKKIVISHPENGIVLYSLTKEEPAHSLAVQLVDIDQRQWQMILESILDAQGIQ
jgi:hypothetical protein